MKTTVAVHDTPLSRVAADGHRPVIVSASHTPIRAPNPATARYAPAKAQPGARSARLSGDLPWTRPHNPQERTASRRSDQTAFRSFSVFGVGLRIGTLDGNHGAHVWTAHFGDRC
jgi:hypothetical protein